MTHDEIVQAVWSLPESERLAILACTFIEQNPRAVPAVQALISLASAMARRLTIEQRYTISEDLRDAADLIENRQVALIG